MRRSRNFFAMAADVEPAIAPIVNAAEATYEANRVQMIYEGSDGDATRGLYDELAKYGTLGQIAVNLFRAQKCSARAKIYPTGHYSTLAYGRKNWSLDQLADLLAQTDAAGFRWGWGGDPNTPKYPWVLYVDLPQGQVSFHSAVKGTGPMYTGSWDGAVDASTDRIIAFVNSVLHPTLPGLLSMVETVAAAAEPPKESTRVHKARSTRSRSPRRRLSRKKRR